ncbi:MAG: Octaprenyl diphosphate synthase (EC / Dimethylallyltransferase (EC / (2E,6E)-farnesyl diphosphate synthase (EC / Geranylgeranyl pyrophosphate synthetase (EC [uncultured Thiotrichaceae bacterium]|uniref:Octaprenyl diphosphate synthase -farnesyl diphosphate synthase ))) n=1 Tax=uncultured Thiotrichaceae bacterium TaxID=298394 RepID=A0A6S6U9L2_9GAMM|nr:MAG: Octaprenyl diphosphate synthase (EC / Dimethylallyltransferase (EC / (2E,6E)-farnesyl diphosphate synthase (EC / Geranylgeranyl pyrophosphate synthetase (EC [uncultured Thiotrichaceae bacterium]
MSGISESLRTYQQRVDATLERVLPAANVMPVRLHDAMRYSVLEGGKRVRPLLVYATGEALGVAPEVLDIPAVSVEMIHAYSLVHDDLPAMDDDDLRRGKPSCHRQFDEATAILVGDALQAQAFQLLASATELDVPAVQRLRMVQQLGRAAGSRGMVGGQAIDLDAVGHSLTEIELENMHIHKTGALIRCSVLLAAYCSTRLDESQLAKLDHYAKCIGLAFQVQDDILDVEGDTDTLGKMNGADAAAGKPTYPSIIGIAAAKKKLHTLHDEAVRALDGMNADLLLEIAEFTVKRLH